MKHVAIEAHDNKVSSKFNWIRAAVLGANDGIVSVAGLVVGAAGATTNQATIFTAGIAGLVERTRRISTNLSRKRTN